MEAFHPCGEWVFYPGDGGVFVPVMELFYPGDGTVLSQ